MALTSMPQKYLFFFKEKSLAWFGRQSKIKRSEIGLSFIKRATPLVEAKGVGGKELTVSSLL